MHKQALLNVPITVDPLERKHRILFSRQRAIHYLQRRMQDRAYRTQLIAEEAIMLDEENRCRARDSGTSVPESSKVAVEDLLKASTAAYFAIHPRHDPDVEDEELEAVNFVTRAGSQSSLLVQQRLERQALYARCSREMEEPSHTDIPVAGGSLQAWNASQAATLSEIPKDAGEEEDTIICWEHHLHRGSPQWSHLVVRC